MPKLPENWSEMTSEEKRSYRLEQFKKSVDKIQFINPESKVAYAQRVQRLIDVMNLQEPDRIPIDLPYGNLPLILYGQNVHTAMYEPEKALDAYDQFNREYGQELECYAAPRTNSGAFLELLDYKQYVWPGHGLKKDVLGLQYVEKEYMVAEEYDDLIRDPSDFWLRKYLPRCFGAFQGFTKFQPFTNMTERVHLRQLASLGIPEVRDMFERLMQAGEAFQRYDSIMGAYAHKGPSHGFPGIPLGFCKAPFDVLGDTLRGTVPIMKDIYRCPDKLLEALDVIADITIANTLSAPDINECVMIHYPLHKGADGWMSKQHFDTFYWPSLKKVMNAFIDEGLIQRMFAEGSYNTRLEYIDEFPKGFVLWFFDQTEMVMAKKILGKNCCLRGNLPTSLLITGQPQ